MQFLEALQKLLDSAATLDAPVVQNWPSEPDVSPRSSRESCPLLVLWIYLGVSSLASGCVDVMEDMRHARAENG